MLFFLGQQVLVQSLVVFLYIPQSLRELFFHPGDAFVDVLHQPSHIVYYLLQLHFVSKRIPGQVVQGRVQGCHPMRPMAVVLVHATGTQGFAVVLAVQCEAIVMNDAFLGHPIGGDVLDDGDWIHDSAFELGLEFEDCIHLRCPKIAGLDRILIPGVECVQTNPIRLLHFLFFIILL